jgi:GNAT superfamily N-acetyltransferase
MTLKIVQHSFLDADTYKQIVALCTRAFNSDYAPIMGTFTAPTHVLAYRKGELVSHALWITRAITYAGTVPLLAAYVEGVVTEPRWQGRGWGTAVMQHLQTAIVSFDLAALSAAQPGWYGRLGWEMWQGPLFVQTSTGLQATPGEDVMILRLSGTPPIDVTHSLAVSWRLGEFW